MCVCVCVCVNARGCNEHKTTLKDLPIMHHAFIRQSCGHYVSIAHVGRTVASSGVGRGRRRRYNKGQADFRIDKVILTEKGMADSSAPRLSTFSRPSLDHNFIQAPRCPQPVKSKLFGTLNFQTDIFWVVLICPTHSGDRRHRRIVIWRICRHSI